MKLKAEIFLFISFYCLLLGASCKKNKQPSNVDPLPPATQIGAKTFGCYLNGNVWIPTGGGAGSGLPSVEAGIFRDADGKLKIFIRSYSYNDYFHIYLKEARPGLFLLNDNTP